MRIERPTDPAIEPEDATGSVTARVGHPVPTADRPVVVIRPSVGVRIGGPALVIAGVAALAAHASWAALLLVAGLLLCLSWVPRVDVGARVLRIRHFRGLRSVPVDAVTAVSLVRVPVGRAHPAHPSLRLGRFCSTPLRARVHCGDERVLQLTVVAWDRWAVLVRFLAGLEHVASDGRTLGRLDRYGWPKG